MDEIQDNLRHEIADLRAQVDADYDKAPPLARVAVDRIAAEISLTDETLHDLEATLANLHRRAAILRDAGITPIVNPDTDITPR